jgi:uncharacterized membrane protein
MSARRLNVAGGVRAGAARVGQRIRTETKQRIWLLPLLGLIPAFLLAIYSMTEPWARGRVIGFWGVSKSPDAALLLAVYLAGMVAASVAVAARGRRDRLAGGVHIVTGALMGLVAYTAFSMVRHAGIKLLFIPIASIRPGLGLVHFVIAAGLVVLLGAVELAVATRRNRRSRELEAEATQGG